ncbi:MAG: OmpA family protein [Clostridiaceae bacterium]|jgi:WD40 repeat protein|nr:OmpA family protein [Clostridiaceae bacterium]
MKAYRLTLILLLVFVFALAAACSGEPEPTQEPPVTVTPEATEGPAETQAPVETKDPVETEDPEIEGEPELVWSHIYEENTVSSMATSGETLAVGMSFVAYTHHISDGSMMDALIYEHDVEDMEFSPDGTVLAAGLGVYGVQLTELADKAEPKNLHRGFNSRLDFSPDGLSIATGNRDGFVWIWELDGLTQTAALEYSDFSNPDKSFGDEWLSTIKYHPSGQLLAAKHWDGKVYIWDLEKNELIRTLESRGDISGHGLRFSPNGKDMAYTVMDSGQYMARVVTVDDGEGICDIVVDKEVRDLNFSPDGKLLAVASYGSPITIWDVASGNLAYTLDREITPLEDASYLNNEPYLVTFTEDGGHVAVASRASNLNGMIELWRLPGAEPIAPPPVDMRTPPPLPGDVLFDTSSAELKQEAFAELEAFAEELSASFPKATLTFVGHTDSQGDEQSNLKLSLDRAQAIKDWFQNWADNKEGIEWVLLVDGKGESELKVPDVDIEGNFLIDAGAMNRRVEIEIEP